MSLGTADPVVSFLMDGDPAIRWQVMRDLLDRPASECEAERSRVATTGWGRSFLDAQLENGSWPEGRWSGTVWTLLVLMDLGIPALSIDGSRAFDWVAGRLIPAGLPVSPEILFRQMDLCHLGFWLRIGSYFTPDDQRLPGLAKVILNLQMPDGGWNCRIRTKPATNHSSFHTTFNVLEGLREACGCGILSPGEFEAIEARAIEFMLGHQMFRSDRTGEIVSERFLQLTYPSHWHYTVLRGLDYVRSTSFSRDERLADALDWLVSRRKENGRWIVEKRIPGQTIVEMERLGGESRWNTLRALRVLRATGKF